MAKQKPDDAKCWLVRGTTGPHPLLVEMRYHTGTLENSLEVSRALTRRPSNESLLGI